MSRKVLVAILGLGLVISACGGGAPTCDTASLVAPNLASPADGVLINDLSPTFQWNYPDNCNPEEYVIDLSTAPDFSGTNLGGHTGDPSTSWYPTTPLDPATMYWWRVAPRNGSTQGPYSTVRWFYTGPSCGLANLVAPIPEWPSQDAVVQASTPGYQWNYPDAGCAPEGYHLQVSSSPDFSNIVTDIREGNPHIIWTPGVALADCLTYYWRVAAIDGASDGPWSTPVSFMVDSTDSCTCDPADLVAPDLSSPGPFEVVDTVLPILEWTNPGSCIPESYAVHLSDIWDMSNTALFGATGSPSTNWAPGVNLEEGTQYWWQVAAGVGFDLGDFSSRSSFFTGPICGDTGIYHPAPELLSPADGADVTNVSDTGDIYAVLRYRPGTPRCIPEGYLVELDTDPSFPGPNLLAYYDIPSTTILTDPLTDCTQYFWRVSALVGPEYTPVSETRSFLTNVAGNCAISMVPGLANEDLFCRLGPGQDFEIAGDIEVGEMAELVGQSEVPGYLVMNNPNRSGICFVHQSFFQIFGDVSLLPYYATPELGLVCSQDLSESDCEAAGGTWLGGMVDAPYCACPE
jgi:hypothetical protein